MRSTLSLDDEFVALGQVGRSGSPYSAAATYIPAGAVEEAVIAAGDQLGAVSSVIRKAFLRVDQWASTWVGS